MKFGNSQAEKDTANFSAYATTFSRTLTGLGGDGLKTVYGEFQDNEG
jgi:hypothetical protein